MARLSTNDLERLAQELASFSRSDIPMPEGLAKLGESLRAGPLRRAANELSGLLQQGLPLSAALRKLSAGVPREFASLVECGEQSGDMDGILDFAVDHGRRLRRQQLAIQSALAYPSLIVFVMLGIVTFFAYGPARRLDEIFAQLGAELPVLTRFFLVWAAVARSVPGMTVVALVMASFVLYWIFTPFREPISVFISRMPPFRLMTRLSDAAMAMKFVSIMTGRGLPLATALRAASLAVWSQKTRAHLWKMAENAERGSGVGLGMEAMMPPTAAFLFAQAESRGDLPGVCDDIAKYCDDRFDMMNQRTNMMLEPVAMLFVGVFVAAVIIVLYLPLFNIPKLIR